MVFLHSTLYFVLYIVLCDFNILCATLNFSHSLKSSFDFQLFVFNNLPKYSKAMEAEEAHLPKEKCCLAISFVDISKYKHRLAISFVDIAKHKHRLAI